MKTFKGAKLKVCNMGIAENIRQETEMTELSL